jgi:hypothetical protein
LICSMGARPPAIMTGVPTVKQTGAAGSGIV